MIGKLQHAPRFLTQARREARRYWKQTIPARQWTNQRVDFAICGTQKGGTTALDAYLREHPDICMADRKEVHFFDDDAQFNGSPDYFRYHSYFTPRSNHSRIGEATPIYMYWADAPRRLWEYNPKMKIIVILRNPISRAYSHWNMERQGGHEHLSFMEALNREEERCRDALPLQHRYFSYVDRGFYMCQIRRLWRFFSRDQVLVLRNDDLQADPAGVLSRVAAFVGVRDFGAVDARSVNAREYRSPLGQAERAHLAKVFQHEIAELEAVFHWDCRDWLLA